MNETASIFCQAAGITADQLSIVIRTVLLVLAMIWSAWMLLGAIHNMDHPDFNFVTLASRLLAVLMIVSSCVGLVYMGG